MSWQTLPHLVPYLISVAISTGVGVYAWRCRDVAGGGPLALVALSQASWTLGYVFELSSSSLEAKIFWDDTQFVGAFIGSLAVLAFALQYTGRKLPHPGYTFGLLAIPNVVFCFLVLTDDLHGLVRPTAWLVPGELHDALVYEFTVTVVVITLYNYGLMLTGVFMLVDDFIRSHRLYRAQIATIIIGLLIPMVGVALTTAGVSLTFHRDTTPFTFAIGNLIVAWGLFRYRLFDVVPVARDRVIESMGDAVMVLDTRDRLVDLNPAAQELIGQTASEAIGQPAAQVFSAWPDLVERYQNVEDAREETVVGAGERQRHIDLRLSSLRDHRGRLTGQLIVVRDITARKQAEEALREAHAELEQRVEERTAELSQANASLRDLTAEWQSTFDAVADSVSMLDLEGRVLRCNRATSSLLGKPEDEIIGRDCCELVRGVSGCTEGCPFERMRETHRRESLVLPLSGRWIEITVDPVLDANDQLIGAVHILSDVTERQRATEALRESEARLAEAQRIAHLGNWEWNVETNELYWSDEIYRIFGLTPHESGRTYDDFLDSVHPDDREFVRRSVDQALHENKVYNIDHRILLPDGSERTVHEQAEVTFDESGRPTRMIGTVQDITERKRTEEALRESEERYRDLVENLNDVIYAVDANGVITYVSPAVEPFIGYRPSEVIGRPFAALVHQEDLQRLRQSMERLLSGHPVESGESRILSKSGEIRWMHTSSRPTLEEKRVVGLQGILRDITERKRAEEALHIYMERLRILHEIDQGILAAQSPETICQAALDHIRRLIPCRRASIWLFDPIAGLRVMSAVQDDGERLEKENFRLESAIGQLSQLEKEIGEQLRQGATVVVKGPRLREAIPEPLHEPLHLNAELVHSYVAVPLVSREQLIGSLNFTVTDSQVFMEEHHDIARQVADQLAIAIQQARLREQVQRHADELEGRVADRTQELQAMYEVMTIASQSMDLETTLARSLERVLEAVESNAGIIHILEPEEGTLRLAVQQGISPHVLAQITSLPAEGLGEWTVEPGEAILLPNTADDPRITIDPLEPRRYIGLPMRAGGQVLGLLGVLRETTQPEFSVEEISLLTSLADRVGAVVESHRLRQQAEQAVVMEERQRLARDLHDSVTQSMYSVTLLAETGRLAAGARDLEVVENCLHRLGDVTQQALKEMRLLVYELRPPVLEQEGLVGALQQRLDAVESRAGVNARLQVEGEIELAASQEEAFYRIALEALNNSLKHASASAVTVRLHADDKLVSLEIADDGQGFDPQAADDAGGMGLATMEERAERAGGVLQVISAPGEGTKVKVTISREQEAKN